MCNLRLKILLASCNFLLPWVVGLMDSLRLDLIWKWRHQLLMKWHTNGINNGVSHALAFSEWCCSSSPGQNGCYFADDIYRCIFVNENFCILFNISVLTKVCKILCGILNLNSLRPSTPYGIKNLFSIGTGNGKMPDGTGPSPEPILTLVRSCGIHLRVISQEMKISIRKKDIYLWHEFHNYLFQIITTPPRANSRVNLLSNHVWL